MKLKLSDLFEKTCSLNYIGLLLFFSLYPIVFLNVFGSNEIGSYMAFSQSRGADDYMLLLEQASY